jgi:uncharacterized membrane protein HdeD (DUF308 family)
MTMSVEAAAQALREAVRETVRRHSTWYLIQGALMVIGGIVALVYPLVSSVAVVLFLGWILIISGIVQGISLIGAQNVPNFWLQLVSVVLSIIVGVLFLRRPGEAVQDLGAQDLKGIAEPVRAWALRASSVESRFEAFEYADQEVCDRSGHLHSSCCNCSLR